MTATAGLSAAAGAPPAAARYVYAVVPAGTALPAGRHELEAVASGGLAAVVSAVPASLRAGAAGGAAGEAVAAEAVAARLRKLEPALRKHESVLEALMGTATEGVVPLRFGTVVTSTEAVRRLLDERALTWRRSLTRVSGRAEWSVKVWWDGDWPAREAGGSGAGGAHERGVAPAGAGIAYLRERRLARDRGRVMRREVADALAAIGRDLDAASVERTDAGARSEGGRRTPLLHSACLVERCAEERLCEALSSSLARHGQGHLTAEVTGPWPPYHFVAAPAEAGA